MTLARCLGLGILVAAHPACERKPDPRADEAAARSLFDQAWQRHRAGDVVSAVRLYRGAIGELGPHHPDSSDLAYRLRFNLGTLLMEQHRFAEAKREFRLAARARENDPRAWYNLGLCEASLARYAQAVAPLERAVQLAPEDPGAHYNLGFAYWKLDRLDQARPHWEEAVRLNPSLQASVDRLLGRAKPPEPPRQGSARPVP